MRSFQPVLLKLPHTCESPGNLVSAEGTWSSKDLVQSLSILATQHGGENLISGIRQTWVLDSDIAPCS